MKKMFPKKEETTNKDLARMIQGLGSGVRGLDLRIAKLEDYMKEGFDLLNNKVDHVDARLSNQLEGLGRRMDDFAENKISRIIYKELESRVVALESKVLTKIKK